VTDRKTIRRRRAVLALCVLGSLVLLTASFGSGLRSIERGALEVFGPIQEGASRVLKPVSDAAGWIGETVDARGDLAEMRSERDDLRVQLAEAQGAVAQNAQLRQMLGMRERIGYADQGPKVARVISEPSNVWTSQLIVDQGANDGVRRGQPVMAAGGLVGRVTEVTGRQAVVELITDEESGVGARVQGSGEVGVVQPEVGDPRDLRLRYVARMETIADDRTVVTAGTQSPRYPSRFPPGLPIGRVELDDENRIHVRPFAPLRALEHVEILTAPGGTADGQAALGLEP
jgi:rod shape-determining protein MreC